MNTALGFTYSLLSEQKIFYTDFYYTNINHRHNRKLGLSDSSATQTSRWSSSKDQEFAWATHCLVAVMKASGLNNPRNIDGVWKGVQS